MYIKNIRRCPPPRKPCFRTHRLNKVNHITTFYHNTLWTEETEVEDADVETEAVVVRRHLCEALHQQEVADMHLLGPCAARTLVVVVVVVVEAVVAVVDLYKSSQATQSLRSIPAWLIRR